MKCIHDIKNLDRLEKEMKYLNKHGVKVGIFGAAGEKEQDGTKIIEYATYLITGTRHMPPRDFMQEGIRGRKARLDVARYQKKVLGRVYKGELTGEQALNQIGIYAVQKIKQAITSNNFSPLSPKTIKRKTRNKQNILRENDFLLNSIGYEIVRL